MNRKGISGIIETVILIALVMALIAVVWVVVNNLVKNQLSNTQSCFNVFDKVTINQRYTCYNQTLTKKELQFSVNVGDLDVQDILVAISGSGQSSTFKINADNATSNLTYYNRTWPVNIPGQNQGLTYIYPLPSSFSTKPDSLEISPIINGKICGVSSSRQQFDSCSSLV